MSYQVLARKLRPADFSSLVGQEHVVRALRHGLDAGRLHHAYLFTGTRGVGKTTVARILAKCLNCEAGISSNPCGACSVCREVQENRFLDLVEVDAASRTRVDDTRDLLEKAQFPPVRGRYKIYLIDEVHMLSTSSFNALLKTLEEPPEHLKFLLATTDPKKVPITVLSRCLQFQLKNISRERIAAYLAEAMSAEGIEFEQEALDLIAKAAQGSMRDALSVADQAIAFGQGKLAGRDVADLLGAVGRDEIAAVLGAVESGQAEAILRISAELAERSADFEAILAELLQALHDLAVAKALGQHEEADGEAAPGAGLSAEALQLHYQIGLLGYRDLRVGPDPKTVFEMTLLRMLAFAPDAAAAGVPPAAGSAKPKQGQDDVRTGQPSHAAGAADSARPTESESTGPQTNAAPLPAAPRPGRPGPGELPSRQDARSSQGGPDGVQASADGRVGGQAALDGAARQDGIQRSADSQAEALADEWRRLAERIADDDPAKLIADRCVLVEKTGDLYRLRLDQAQGALLTDRQDPALEQALRRLLGREVRIQIEAGELPAESPAQRRQRLEAERQAAARRLFEQDSTVRSLIDRFDGRVVDAHYLAPAASPDLRSAD